MFSDATKSPFFGTYDSNPGESVDLPLNIATLQFNTHQAKNGVFPFHFSVQSRNATEMAVKVEKDPREVLEESIVNCTKSEHIVSA